MAEPGATQPPREVPVTEEQVIREIERVLRQELAFTGTLTPDTTLVEELQLDSVSLLTLVVELENRFRVALREEDAGGIRTVSELARLVVLRTTETPT